MNKLIKDAKSAAKEAREKALMFKRAEAIDCIQKHFKDYFEYFDLVGLKDDTKAFVIKVKGLADFELCYLFNSKGLFYWDKKAKEYFRINNLLTLGQAIEKHENI